MEYILDEKGYKPKRAKEIKYIINENNCFICISHPKSDNNYLLAKRNGKTYRLHRYIYEIYNNVSIPNNMVVMHTCDNTLCINPKHLKIGTQQDNVNDMYNKGRNKTNYGYKHKEESKKKLSNSKQLLNKKQLLEIKKFLLEKTDESMTQKRKRIGKIFNVSDKTIGRIERGLAPWYSEVLDGGYKDWILEEEKKYGKK